jgi:hypothetical protein
MSIDLILWIVATGLFVAAGLSLKWRELRFEWLAFAAIALTFVTP